MPDLRLGLDGDDAERRPTAPRCAGRTRRWPWRSSPSATSRTTSSTRPTSTGCSTPAIDYLLDEPDRRGYVPELGWINATAHAADLLKFLVRNPLTGEADHRRVLDALQTLLTRATGPVFVDDEEDRLVLVVVDVIGRETISDDELCDWIDTFGSWLAGRAGRVRPGVARGGRQPQAVRPHAAPRPVLAGPPPRAEVRQARDHRPRHRPPLRRRARSDRRRFLVVWWIAERSSASSRTGRSDRLDDQDVAGGVVGDVVGDGAEQAADALHAAVADDDQLGLEALGLVDQRVGRLAVDRRRRRLDALGPERRRLLVGDLLGGRQAGDDELRRSRRRDGRAAASWSRRTRRAPRRPSRRASSPARLAARAAVSDPSVPITYDLHVTPSDVARAARL